MTIEEKTENSDFIKKILEMPDPKTWGKIAADQKRKLLLADRMARPAKKPGQSRECMECGNIFNSITSTCPLCHTTNGDFEWVKARRA